MKTFTEQEVLRLIRDELALHNKGLRVKTEIAGLTSLDIQYIGAVAMALKSKERGTLPIQP